MIRFLLPCFVGIAAFVFLTEAGATILQDPTTKTWSFTLAGETEAQDSIMAMPLYFRELLPVGVLGLLTAAMLAAFMSTHDSYLLCWSSVISRDIISPLAPRKATPERQLLWTRIGIVVIGIYVLVWGIFYEPSQDVWEYLGITGAVYFTGAIVVLSAGLYWKRASSMGARFALLAGLSAVIGLGPVKKALGLADVSAPVIGLCTLGIAFLAMIVGSLAFPDRPEGTAREEVA